MMRLLMPAFCKASREPAREIGRSDSQTFSARLQLKDGVDRLASGPVHFAHAGWALVDILAELADGNAVKVVPVHAELTTQEAADLLNVSRPHFVKLLEDGVLAFHRTGKHRRVRFADLMQYKEARERASEQAMAELAQQSQELGMGYE